MVKRKSVLLLLLSGWVVFCLVWFFTIYQKDERKPVDENKAEVVSPSVSTDTASFTATTENEDPVKDTSGSASTPNPAPAPAVDSPVVVTKNQHNSVIDKGKDTVTSAIAPAPATASGTPTVVVAANKKIGTCYFYLNSDKKVKNFPQRLARHLQQQLASENAKILITGHTDYIGSTEYNYRLGIQRAERVKQLLVKKGIAADRILVLSKGEEQPIANNKSINGRAKNRRVEINITLS
jgi:outer membrane protein OmpA-like peptidoglycan-associated protein